MENVTRMGSIRQIAERVLPRRQNSQREASSQNGESSPVNFNNLFFQKITNKMDSIMKSCQKIQNLNNSPPYILDILPDIHAHIRKIINEHNSSHNQGFEELNRNDFFQVFATNLYDKCKDLSKILKIGKANLSNPKSATRRDLSRMSLIFSHMLSELKALFPNGKFIGLNNFKITKPEASNFWISAFGPQILVSWGQFKRELNRVHPIGNSVDDERALKDTINLTQNEFISQFEFDVFTRLFQPWEQLLVNWKVLAVTHPGYASFMTYDDVRESLRPFKEIPGSYLFRLSCTRLGQWAIGYVTDQREILQTIPQNKSLMQVLIDGGQSGFYIRPKGREANPDLSQYVHETKAENIEVTEEEYQIYCQMGSSFQLCKICSENEKDTRIEPCNHLMCSECLAQWQMKDTSSSPTCPFCRCEIRGTQKIFVNPFSNKAFPVHSKTQSRPLPEPPIEREQVVARMIEDESPYDPVTSLSGADNPAFDFSQISENFENSVGAAAPPIPPRVLRDP